MASQIVFALVTALLLLSLPRQDPNSQKKLYLFTGQEATGIVSSDLTCLVFERINR